ncbi:integrin alpha-4 [Clupea harengus]|uniref:Integrin alpha-4 n=1 Tax=Clupea harengus TaxID=7950 RepID=A0A6P8H4H3_CLUHA|nr:integrin alpha-4 [Clupea harengus]
MERGASVELCWRFNKLMSILACIWCQMSVSAGYNLDVDHSLNFNGPNGSLFGYSVLLHENDRQAWLVVGAPVADSKFNKVKKPGAIYKCTVSNKGNCEEMIVGNTAEGGYCGKTCASESMNQWLGVSLSREPSSGTVMACGHRWKNVYYSKSENHKLPHGICFKLEPGLDKYAQLTPCYRDHQRKFGEDYGSCQAGMSNFMTEDLIIMGAPGTSYWTGSVLVYNSSSNVLSAYLDEDSIVLYGSYLGYSVGAGHFLSPHSTEVVGGAPQHGQTGSAYIFQTEGNILKIVETNLKGSKLGSYYGASVCAVDLNADGLSDLLVGAPMYSTVREEGRVHVYINQGQADMKEMEFALVGSAAYAARFGETITNLGDIDDDGFSDVAVGAPHEEDLQGAIYIYNGRKNGIRQSFSQRITGKILGNTLKMFGQSISGGIDVDGNGFPDVAVGAFLSNAAVVLRTRPVVKVEASLLLPDSVNRSLPLCSENGQRAVCVSARLCFNVTGRRLDGRIKLRYNLTADVHHKEGFPSRFYFHGNGTSNITTGQVWAKTGALVCETHQAFMRKDIRDIFTAIHFEVRYELGEHSTARAGSRNFPPLKPMLQQTGEHNNLVIEKTEFARYCAWENCSTNLQVSAHLVLPQSYKNMSYFALGSGKTIMLNTTLFNAGDDAFLPKMHLRFPSNLHYIKVLDAEEKYASCDIVEENKTTIGLDCNVGNLYLPALAKLNISFLLDVTQSSPENMTISIYTASDNYENEDLLHDNTATLSLPLKYGVDLTVHGYVSPTSFVFGDQEPIPVDCYMEKLNYTYKVVNLGPSKSVNTKVEIDIPQSLAPYEHQLLRIAELRSSSGECVVRNDTLWTTDDCDVPKSAFLYELVFFLSKVSKRRMYCSRGDSLCMTVECNLGDLEMGKEVSIQIGVELNPTVLQIMPGRHGVMLLESLTIVTSPRTDPNTFLLQDHISASVLVEAHHNQKPNLYVGVFIIVLSLIIGLIILLLLIVMLWKAGFFKRSLKEKQDDLRRDSWDYVPKSETCS